MRIKVTLIGPANLHVNVPGGKQSQCGTGMRVTRVRTGMDYYAHSPDTGRLLERLAIERQQRVDSAVERPQRLGPTAPPGPKAAQSHSYLMTSQRHS